MKHLDSTHRPFTQSGLLKRSYWLLASTCLLALQHLTAAVPDFTVTSPSDDKKFVLSEAKGSYVALHFLLKTECPYCLKHTRDYATKSAGDKQVVHVFLKPDSEAMIKSWSTQANAGDAFADLAIYQDTDAKLADRFGIPGGYSFHGETVHYPALVLLDPQGNEVFRYVGKSNADRLSYEAFKVKLDELKEKAAAAVQHFNLGSDRVALKGYDPVGYWTQRAAVKGRKELALEYQGVTYWFATDENRKLFQALPAKYMPEYGGWCATAMAKGEKVEIDPTNFKVTDGRLFLFFKAFYANAIKDWNKDEPGLTKKADQYWMKLVAR